MTTRKTTPVHFEIRHYSVEGVTQSYPKVEITVWEADDYTADGRSLERGAVRFEWFAAYPDQGKLLVESSIWSGRGVLRLAARLQGRYAKLGAARTIEGVLAMLRKMGAREFRRSARYDLVAVEPGESRCAGEGRA